MNQRQTRLIKAHILGTAAVLPAATLVLMIVFLKTNNTAAYWLLLYFATATLMGWLLYVFNRRRIIHLAGVYLVCLYLALSFGVVWSIGVEVVSMALCSWAVILASIFYGYRFALVPLALSVIFLSVFRASELQGIVYPAYVFSQKPTDFITVILLALFLNVLAAFSDSLYQFEQTRRKLRETEENLISAKKQPGDIIKRQRQKLRAAESERMRQLYRLAKAGEISTIMLHDLASNVTSLALEMDSIETDGGQASVRRAKDQIKQIRRTLIRARQQLKGGYQPKPFDIVKEVNRTVRLLRAPAHKAGVTLHWVKPDSEQPFDCFGEKGLFRQLFANIVNNAIESYGTVHALGGHKVLIVLEDKGTTLELSVSDWGVGIAPEAAAKVFEPFYTTKGDGMGMGLYLTKRLIESNFGGHIALKSTEGRTSVTMVLPRISAKRQQKERLT